MNQEPIKSPTASSSPHNTYKTKRIQITKKNRTISTLSDFNYSNLDQNNINGSSVYYRLASCGQDNQICFWDLTEDVLKEKSSNSNRARLSSFNVQSNKNKSTSAAMPQIVAQSNESANIDASKGKASIYSSQKSSHSSIVSTARNLFSLKHSEMGKGKFSSKSKLEYSPSEQADSFQQNPIASTSSSSSFFKKVRAESSNLFCLFNDSSLYILYFFKRLSVIQL